MERRYALAAGNVGLESRVGSDPPTIVGYASVFYTPNDPGTEYELWNYGQDDRCVERIMPTAFDRVLGAAADVAALFNHDPNCVLGRSSAGTLKLSKDARGLRYEISPPAVPMAQTVVESIKRGDLKGSSFSFRCLKDGCRWVQQGGLTVREVHSVDGLYDVGPVTFAAYGGSTTGTRSSPGVDEARTSFEDWRKADARRKAILAQAAARSRCVELGL